jgi:tRNA (cytidine/uridine-2'-O-)-methyltransferase
MIHIVLYRPEKPQNTGNIMRTCVAIHATLHIIGPITFSVENKDLQRVGMDYIDDLKMEFHPTYEDFIKAYPHVDTYYVTRYAKTVYSSYDFSKKQVQDIFLMFGRESTGIPHDILKEHQDRLMRIPMVPEARSLNLSNCVALVTYEVLRQQNFPNLATEEAIKGPDFLFKE